VVHGAHLLDLSVGRFGAGGIERSGVIFSHCNVACAGIPWTRNS
jgi:hypothetical protein